MEIYWIFCYEKLITIVERKNFMDDLFKSIKKEKKPEKSDLEKEDDFVKRLELLNGQIKRSIQKLITEVKKTDQLIPEILSDNLIQRVLRESTHRSLAEVNHQLLLLQAPKILKVVEAILESLPQSNSIQCFDFTRFILWVMLQTFVLAVYTPNDSFTIRSTVVSLGISILANAYGNSASLYPDTIIQVIEFLLKLVNVA